MTLNLGVLPNVLFSPKTAFESIKDKTTMGDGILMYILISAISFILSSLITLATLGSIVSPAGAAYEMTVAIVGFIVGLVIGIIFMIIIALVAAKIATALTKGNYSLDKTVGFLGYAQIVGLIMSIVIILLIITMGNSAIGPGGGMSASAAGTIGILGIVTFIWQLYVNGAAVAVANDVGLGIGIVSYFIAALIIGLIMVVVVVAAIAAIGLSMWSAGTFGGF